ncbi:hypothetical protein FTN76_00470 [Chlamydia trachomatis]|uniref:Uncharacterized protein n=2 Tax=Chlamydia trachomatis TaxID=813 RepID=A0A6H2W0N8_CHLTB|nr:hypothetical protein [Chlamydia trachomatis]AGJ64171.1 hypothetical protein CTLINITIAL_00450 [Chlamydia trachomatis L2/434/Bu(i)]AGJ65111.1 hypothetical protein CTLFINAL_00450 [Chlamydia trachomatis L2/434/Bu(f)]AGR95083.1 hypothetical protein CTRC46_03790 [Chlamydia trachomatis RC-L2(s)/46]AGR96963.1 hypothetical protein CTRC943_03780 [Chlamydia trachomatis RC-J/943]AGR98804.1 hypothetical protein CTRC3_03820 [Chlamydia trachomatis RC-L2(s)/3]
MNKKLQDLSKLLTIELFKKRTRLETVKKALSTIEHRLQQIQEHIAKISLTRHKQFLCRSYTHEYDQHLEHLQREQTSLYKQHQALKTSLKDAYGDIQKQLDQRKIIEKIHDSKYPIKSANN